MQFFNMLMLGGLAAVAIPIIIQILTRKNVRRISWGAWLFLDKTMKKRRRKVLLEDLLLLACRCLALALLALAFARPFIDPASSLTSDIEAEASSSSTTSRSASLPSRLRLR